MRKTSFILSLATLVIIAINTKQVLAQSPLCSEQAAQHIAHAYILSWRDSTDDLFSYIRQNRTYFREGGEAIQCAERLGSTLVAWNIANYDPQAYNKAYERAMSMGAGEHAGDIAYSVTKDDTQAAALGLELQWLAKVLPPATRLYYKGSY